MILALLLLGCAPEGWRVHPVEYGQSRARRAMMVQGAPKGERAPFSWLFFVVRDGDHVVLVDTGFEDPALAERWGIQGFRAATAALAELGIAADAVDDVVITHPHWDHLGGVGQFPEARVWIQAAALDWAREAASAEPGAAVREADLAVLERARVQPLDGDREIAPGLVVHAGGGHTPGSQWVEVRGAYGPVALAGDLAYLFENLDEEVPPGGSLDPAADLAAYGRMAAAGEVIPGHDPRVMERYAAWWGPAEIR